MNEQVNDDLQKRVEGFNAELIPLLGKYRLGLGATANLTPDGRVFARPQLFDDTKKEEAVVSADAPAATPAPETPAPTPAPAADPAAITEG